MVLFFLLCNPSIFPGSCHVQGFILYQLIWVQKKMDWTTVVDKMGRQVGFTPLARFFPVLLPSCVTHALIIWLYDRAEWSFLPRGPVDTKYKFAYLSGVNRDKSGLTSILHWLRYTKGMCLDLCVNQDSTIVMHVLLDMPCVWKPHKSAPELGAKLKHANYHVKTCAFSRKKN